MKIFANDKDMADSVLESSDGLDDFLRFLLTLPFCD